MSLTTSAPLSLAPYPDASSIHASSRQSAPMSYQTAEDRSPYGGYYERPPGSAHGAPPPVASRIHASSSPERLHSSSGVYHKGVPPHQPPSHAHQPPPQSPSHHVYPPQDIGPGPGSSHGYPPPITPLSGSSGYPPQPPSGGYYGLAGQPQDHVPSPPPTGNGRPTSANFTPDGIPIVPVGISGGKMFQCRGFGDCDKVFTRSEHLARHVRKHTGERPFPCHCGKAFSRLDNLRQHAATVHADQAALNENMLSSLASVHAALSQRAGREQRKRGEVVEVPKNAVERPRHTDTGYRGQRPSPSNSVTNSPYTVYPNEQWNVPQHPRPRTGGGWDYSYQPGMEGEGPGPSAAAPLGGPMEDAGPSRRPGSSAEGYPSYQPPYYDQPPPNSSGGRPPNSAPGTASSTDSMAQLPYPYRPMSSNGRELPLPAHYAESEPPTTAHGPPPHSPMYPPGVTHANWSSPPAHSNYPPSDPSMYPPPIPASNAPYPPEAPSGYGPAPPSSAGSYYSYPPPAGQAYYGPQGQPQSYGSVPPPQGPGAPYPNPSYGPPPPNPQDSPFSYNASHQNGPYHYGPGGYDSRKRRAEDDEESARKHARSSSAVTVPSNGLPPQHLNDALHAPAPRQQDSSWLPPTSERRSSLAISALLGSPQQNVRSRPSTADVTQSHQSYGPTGTSTSSAAFTYPPIASGNGSENHTVVASGSVSLPATPMMNGTPRRGIAVDSAPSSVPNMGSDNMEQKAKALLGSGR